YLIILQLPIGTQNPDDNTPIDLSRPFDVIVYIILPIVLIIMYLYWKRKDRKSTRLNSSHVKISYAVFCLKTKNYQLQHIVQRCIVSTVCSSCLSSSLTQPPPCSTLFPYTTLFRSFTSSYCNCPSAPKTPTTTHPSIYRARLMSSCTSSSPLCSSSCTSTGSAKIGRAHV